VAAARLGFRFIPKRSSLMYSSLSFAGRIEILAAATA
jgi:hypothetical protein